MTVLGPPRPQNDRATLPRARELYRELSDAADPVQLVIAKALQQVRSRKALHRHPDYPQTKEQLRDWIFHKTGWRLPMRTVCPDHDAPMDFVWDVFTHTVTDALLLASRGAGKTLTCATVELAVNHFKDGFGVSHFGAVANQAKRAYVYYRKGLKDKALRGQIVGGEPHISGTTWMNGSYIEILPATENQVMGGHPHMVMLDELERAQATPYENAKGMPMEYTSPEGERFPGQFIGASTRTDVRGLMQKALDEAEEKGTKVYEFCVLDTMEACDLPDDHPLWEWLPEGGLLEADGWRSLNDVMKHYSRVDTDTWLAQYLNKKPAAKALIYSTFDAALNVTDAAAWVPNAGPLYIGYDWGFVDDSAFVFCQFRANAFWQFHEIVGAGKSEREWVREVVKYVMTMEGYAGPAYEDWEQIWQHKKPWPEPWPKLWPECAGDPTAIQLTYEMREHGLGAARAGLVGHQVVNGQDVVRAALYAGEGLRRYFVHPDCRVTITSFENFKAKQLPDGSYSRTPDPDAQNHKFSHALDSIRYMLWRYRKQLGLVIPTEAADLADKGEYE